MRKLSKLFSSKSLLYYQKARTFSERKHPFKKTWDTVKMDFVNTKKKIQGKAIEIEKIFPHHCDVLIVGGGVMGSSIAYWLKERADDGLSVVVAEKDTTVTNFNSNEFNQYQQCTSTLSVGGIRQQFSLQENIELSLASAEFMRNIKHHLSIEGMDPPNIQFNPGGYLFLATEASADVLQENAKLQRSLGAKVELLNATQLQQKFPFMNFDGVALACHGLENEGWFDPWSLLHAFKNKAVDLGAEYVNGSVDSFIFKKTDTGLPSNQIESANVVLSNGETKNIKFAVLIIAAGSNSGHIGSLAGMGKGEGILQFPLPIEPRKRYVYTIHCPDGPGIKCPFVIDPTGAYVRREGHLGNYICGMSPPLGEKEPSTDNLDVDYEFFETYVWPIIANRVPSLENCKVKSAWAGFYDFNSFDENAIIGPHGGFHNVYIAAGFSGHGIQQSPAVGRAIMELIVDSGYVTIDLSRLEFNRFVENQPLWESNIV